jgi:hypothetical protein
MDVCVFCYPLDKMPKICPDKSHSKTIAQVQAPKQRQLTETERQVRKKKRQERHKGADAHGEGIIFMGTERQIKTNASQFRFLLFFFHRATLVRPSIE